MILRRTNPVIGLGVVAMAALLPLPASLLAPVPVAAAPGADSGVQISRSNLAKTASFTITRTTAPKGSASLIQVYKIQVNGNYARVDYDDPALGSIRYLANAQGMFLYIPDSKTANKYNFKGGVEAALQQAFRFITVQSADLKKVGKATVSGQPTTLYKNAKNGALVYVGQQPGFRLPVKATLTNEGGTQSFVVSNIKLNVTIPAAQFALPAGTQIISGDSGGAAGMLGGGASGSGKG